MLLDRLIVPIFKKFNYLTSALSEILTITLNSWEFKKKGIKRKDTKLLIDGENELHQEDLTTDWLYYS